MNSISTKKKYKLPALSLTSYQHTLCAILCVCVSAQDKHGKEHQFTIIIGMFPTSSFAISFFSWDFVKSRNMFATKLLKKSVSQYHYSTEY